MRRVCCLVCLLFIAAFAASSETITFKDVKIHRHRNATDRVLVDKVGALVFDDFTRTLTFDEEGSDYFQISYDDVVKAVFDVTTHMRFSVLTQVIKAGSFPGLIAGTALEAGHVRDYWFYLEYKDHDRTQSVLLEVPKSHSAQVIAKAGAVFGARVSIPVFPEKDAVIELKDLPAIKSRHEVTVSRDNHPLPEVRPDKATVVVVCPPLAARYAGWGNQYKLHANDEVIAVNKQGTYSFAYLDPGKYRLASQTEMADGFDMRLEAGEQYFLVQNTFTGYWKPETTLSRNSREVVMYLVDGSFFSDWKLKRK